MSLVEMTNIIGDDENGLLEAANRRAGPPTLSETGCLSRVDSVSALVVKFKQMILYSKSTMNLVAKRRMI